MTARLASFLPALALFLAGCSTPMGCYEDGIDVVNAYMLPDSDDVEDALEEFTYAIDLAAEDLAEDAETRTPCLHDQTAYLIPASWLGKARLHGRFNQIRAMEDACWAAIRDGERFLGAHIRGMSGDQRGQNLLFANYSVFFRREKIRRHAFVLLKETYRAAGEKDLESLMRVQIGLSDIYLRSPAAHGEEEYIRTIENSDWVRRYALDKEDIGHGIQQILLSFAIVLQAAAVQMQKAQLQQQAATTQDPAVKANLEQRMRMLDQQMQRNMEQAMETMEKMEKAHQAAIAGIEGRYRNTVVGSIMANFEMLDLSAEVKQLEAYQVVKQKKEAFDRYVLNRGFDRGAAQALVDLRTSLDALTLELQRRRT